MNLVNRVNKLEKQIEQLKSSQILGGDNVSCYYQVLSWTTPQFQWSSVLNRYGINVGTNAWWMDYSKALSFKSDQNLFMAFMQVVAVEVKRSDGVVIKQWSWTANQGSRSSTGENIAIRGYDSSDATYLVVVFDAQNVPYNANLNYFTYEIKVTVRKNMDILVESD